MSILFALAGLAGATGFFVHAFVGGRYAAVPLLTATELPVAAGFTQSGTRP